jgi:cytoskeletal protein RodZ
MATVADQLQTAREARHLKIEQVADITKIRSDHIRALEEGNFEVFSAPVYIRGFVRTYATLLKLNVPQVMTALDSELGQTKKFAEPPALSQPANGPLDKVMLWLSKLDVRRTLILVGVVLAMVLITLGSNAWRKARMGRSSAERKPLIYESTGKSSGEKLTVPPP